MTRLRFLSAIEVAGIHSDMIESYGGEPGLRDAGLLESAVHAPQAGVDGSYFHEDVFHMAAAYLCHIVKNHPFYDGNKRAGLATALVFLEFNGYEAACDDEELEAMTLRVAEGKLGKEQAADFFRRHASPGAGLEGGNR